jgi:amino acid transporter
MQHYVSEPIDLLLVLVAAWTLLAVIFVIYAFLARLKYPVSDSIFGQLVVISLFIITIPIWLPITVVALALSLIGHFWSRFRTKPRADDN